MDQAITATSSDIRQGCPGLVLAAWRCRPLPDLLRSSRYGPSGLSIQPCPAPITPAGDRAKA